MSLDGDRTDPPTCAECGATIDANVQSCPDCGNTPRNEVLAGLIGCVILGAVLFLLVPSASILILPVIGLLGAALVVLDHSPAHTDSLV